MALPGKATFCLLLLLSCSRMAAQEASDLILATRRAGVVEFISPATLKTVARLHFDLPAGSAGLGGASASADGSVLYVEGPIPSSPNGCCVLYAVDLATLQTKQVASIPLSRSRESFLVFSDGLMHPPGALAASGAVRTLAGKRLYLSPDGRWLFGLRTYRAPAIDVYDYAQGEIVRQLTLSGLEGDWWMSGIWVGERFYLYANKYSEGYAPDRLWTVPAESNQLGQGVTVVPFGQVPGCSAPSSKEIVAAGVDLFVYETFGHKLDRRPRCQGQVPGGAWTVDPTTGQLLRQIAPDLHFSTLIPDRDGSVLYGLIQGPNRQDPTELDRIDPRDGQVLQSRALDPDFWRIVIAPLRLVPAGDLRSVLH